jgi:hypothetical protein
MAPCSANDIRTIADAGKLVGSLTSESDQRSAGGKYDEEMKSASRRRAPHQRDEHNHASRLRESDDECPHDGRTQESDIIVL